MIPQCRWRLAIRATMAIVSAPQWIVALPGRCGHFEPDGEVQDHSDDCRRHGGERGGELLVTAQRFHMRRLHQPRLHDRDLRGGSAEADETELEPEKKPSRKLRCATESAGCSDSLGQAFV
jgi:hypothetical protein